MAFERILVPTDFSEFAGFAVQHATGLALDMGARVDLVHSVYVPNIHDVATPLDIERQIEDSARRRLIRLLEDLEKAGVEAEMHVVRETATVGIRDLAEKLGSDCIVMGTRGLTGLKHVLLGSTAERTLRIAPCPVLTVAGPPGEGAVRPQKILVATDFSDTADHALARARHLLHERQDGEVVLLHVYQRPIATGPYRFAARDGFTGLRTRLLETLEGMADPFRDEGLDAVVRVEEAESTPAEIARVGEDEQCDWIVLGTHGRSGLAHIALGSVAERVVRVAERPTLTVKLPD